MEPDWLGIPAEAVERAGRDDVVAVNRPGADRAVGVGNDPLAIWAGAGVVAAAAGADCVGSGNCRGRLRPAAAAAAADADETYTAAVPADADYAAAGDAAVGDTGSGLRAAPETAQTGPAVRLLHPNPVAERWPLETHLSQTA